MVDEGTAASGTRRHLDVDAAPRQQADGGVVDLRPQDLLSAASKQDDALASRRLGSGGAGTGDVGRAQLAGRRQFQHRHELLEAERAQHRDEGTGKPRRLQRQSHPVGMGKRRREQGAH